jgi:hypothetical protein
MAAIKISDANTSKSIVRNIFLFFIVLFYHVWVVNRNKGDFVREVKIETHEPMLLIYLGQPRGLPLHSKV